MKPKKLVSLGNKYFSIPAEHLWYYPSEEAIKAAEPSPIVDPDDLTVAEIQAQREKDIKSKGAKRLPHKKLDAIEKKMGRPKKALKLDPSQKSILKFLPKKN